MIQQRIRTLSLIEAQVITSPARIMLRFAADSRSAIDMRFVNLVRGENVEAESYSNPLIAEARAQNLPLSVVSDAAPYDLALLAKLKGLIRQYRPQVVQTNSIKSHFLVSLLGKRDFGWVAFHHGYTAENLKMRAYNSLDRWSLRACDRVVTVCNAFADEIAAKGVRRSQIDVIPNSIPADFLRRDEREATDWRARLGVKPGEKVIFSAGRLSVEKGHTFLVDAAARLASSGKMSPFKVLIAGAGLLEDQLQRQIDQLGVQSQVQLIGFHSDIRPLYQIADVFVLPSLSEGSPMVLLESMISRVPVVTTLVGGIPEAITNEETGLLVPAADPAALSRALGRLLTEPILSDRLINQAYAHVRRDYNPDLYNSRVAAVFERVLRPQMVGAQVEVSQ